MGAPSDPSDNGRSPRAVLERRVRLYRTLRTAHLERALELTPATIVYRERRYDFDDALAARLDIVQAGPLKAALLLLRDRVDELEINEPLMRSSARTTAAALVALRLRNALARRRTAVVTYAIENLDPFAVQASGLRSRLRRAIDLLLTKLIWRNVDRIAFGTAGARELYRARLAGGRASATLIPALPEPCASCPVQDADGLRVLFLGALSDRKGFPLVMAAWPQIRAAANSASITVIGKGPMEGLARDWAAREPEVDLIIDPPRSIIHQELRRAAVLVLPSQPQPSWREQVGLPITEALAHGVPVVTTTETGLADWLVEHGHGVIPATGSAADLAVAVATQLKESSSRASILDSLPRRDGRLAADDWLFGNEDGTVTSTDGIKDGRHSLE